MRSGKIIERIFPSRRYELRKHIKARHPDKPLTMIKLELDYALARENQGDSPLGPDFRPKPVEPLELDESDGAGSEEPEASVSSQDSAEPVNLNSLHFNCFHCSFSAKSMTEFAHHVRTHDQNSPVKSPGSSKAPASPIHTDDDELEQFVTVTPVYGNRASAEETPGDADVDESFVHKCTLCPYQTNDIDAFEMHSRTHLPYRCGHCTYSAYQRSKIKKHHANRHAAEGLALQVMEQNPKPDKKATAAAPDAAAQQTMKPKYKPGPKCKKSSLFIGYEPDNGEDEEIEFESDSESEISRSLDDYAKDKAYQPTIGLLDVQTLQDELLAVLLAKYGATRTPWCTFLAGSDEDSNRSSPCMEDDDLGEVSENTGLVFASSLEVREDREGADMEDDDDILDVGEEGQSMIVDTEG